MLGYMCVVVCSKCVILVPPLFIVVLLFNKYLLNIYYVPSSKLDTWIKL